MRKFIVVAVIAVLTSCKGKEDRQTPTDEADPSAVKVSGKDLFENEGNCIACHKPDQKIIGPSLEEIAKIYKTKKGAVVLFLKEEAEPIVDPSQYEIMKTNFAITKSLSDEQLQALEDYIYSFHK